MSFKLRNNSKQQPATRNSQIWPKINSDNVTDTGFRRHYVTTNDVITGVVIYGTRLYMQGVNKETSNGKCTALVLFNTRAVGGYKSVSDMIKPNLEMPWGNHFSFLPVPLPKLTSNDLNSASVFLTGRLLEILRKVEGPEATAKYIHATLKHTSMGITNLIGPLEEMSLANHSIKGLYFVVAGPP